MMAAATEINIAGVTKASSVSAVLTTNQVRCLIAFAVPMAMWGTAKIKRKGDRNRQRQGRGGS